MHVMKVWRQAGSLAVVVPKSICQATRIVAGSFVLISLEKDGDVRIKRLMREDGKLNVKGGKK